MPETALANSIQNLIETSTTALALLFGMWLLYKLIVKMIDVVGTNFFKELIEGWKIVTIAAKEMPSVMEKINHTMEDIVEFSKENRILIKELKDDLKKLKCYDCPDSLSRV